MFKNLSSHARAVIQALFVTFLWSTSWVLIKIGLVDIPALTFGGLRYTLAFLTLLLFIIFNGRQNSSKKLQLRLPAKTWIQLIVLGLIFYTFTQGAMFWALFYLPSATVSLLLNFTTPIVALMGIVLLREVPTLSQWIGMAIFTAGVLIYFYPVDIPPTQMIGLIIAGVGVLANALSSVLGRHVNQHSGLDPLPVTVISMGIGALALLALGIIVQGLPRLSWLNWLIILWLAVINSAYAFTLWNRTLRTLSATESSIINNTMLIQIAVLAWVFLGESLGIREIIGLALATVGAMVVPVKFGRRS